MSEIAETLAWGKQSVEKIKLPEFSHERCQYVDIKGVCGTKVNGLWRWWTTDGRRSCRSVTSTCSN